MIKLNRGKPPSEFSAETFQKLKSEAQEFYSQASSTRSQRRFSFEGLAKFIYPAARQILMNRFHNKCAYCETKIDRADIDHFRPKSGVAGDSGETYESHYWWLAFDWQNYYVSCATCNAMKGNRFPIQGLRAKIGTAGRLLLKEEPLLLDPAWEDPAPHLYFSNIGTVAPLTERGKVTIEVLQLNRAKLVENRKKNISVITKTLDVLKDRPLDLTTIAILDEVTSQEKEFSLMARQRVAAWATQRANNDPVLLAQLGAYIQFLAVPPKSSEIHLESNPINLEAPNIGSDFYRHARYIQKIEITNIGGIQHLVLQPQFGTSSPGSWLVLLGENGVGKTTVLKAIALALMGENQVRKLNITAADLVRNGCLYGEILIQIMGFEDPIVLRADKKRKHVRVTPPAPQAMCLAYGATRLPRSASSEEENKFSRIRVDNLFNPFFQLSDGRPWLHDAPRAEFNVYARALLDLVPHSEESRITRRKGQLYLSTENTVHSLSSLSSGYQAVVALAIDIMEVMRLGWKNMAFAEGVVLIDEIDAHLHPRWKMRIVPMLRKVFPRIQFIVTSHEPLTLRTLDSSEITVLARDSAGSSMVLDPISFGGESPKYLSVDQILKSELFGLHSTTDIDLDDSFEEYYNLLAKTKPDSDERQRLATLKERLREFHELGRTPREALVLEAADEYLAERRAQVRLQSSEEKQAARLRLKNLWSQVSTEPIPSQRPASQTKSKRK